MQRTFHRQCPHCTHEVTWPETATYPFCSERCRLIDLGKWASGDYRIPGEPVPDDERWSDSDAAEDEVIEEP